MVVLESWSCVCYIKGELIYIIVNLRLVSASAYLILHSFHSCQFKKNLFVWILKRNCTLFHFHWFFPFFFVCLFHFPSTVDWHLITRSWKRRKINSCCACKSYIFFVENFLVKKKVIAFIVQNLWVGTDNETAVHYNNIMAISCGLNWLEVTNHNNSSWEYTSSIAKWNSMKIRR